MFSLTGTFSPGPIYTSILDQIRMKEILLFETQYEEFNFCKISVDFFLIANIY